MSWHFARIQETFAAVQEGIAARGAQMFPSLTVEQARARAFRGLARGVGMGIVAGLHPPAWRLPRDVVTAPLIDG